MFRLTVDADALPSFTTLLQSGIKIAIPGKQSLLQILATLPGFTLDYLGTTVQTIFYNGIPLDDLQKVPADGAVIALSAAMPGLAGAIFRKQSIHAALRSVAKEAPGTSPHDSTAITLKLFNHIALDRGEELLARGITIPAEVFANFLNKRPYLLEGIRDIHLGQQRCATSDFQNLLASDRGDIGLQIVAATILR